MDPAIASRVEELVRDLSSPVEEIRKAAVVYLSELYDPSVLPHLRKLIDDESPSIRYFARRALGRYQPDEGAPAPAPVLTIEVDQICRDLTSDAPETRIQAAMACYARRDPRLVQSLAGALAGEVDLKVIATLVKALGSQRDPSVVPHLLEQLHHADHRIRSNTVDAAMMIDDPEIIEPICLMAADQSGRVRASVALYLAYRDPRRVPAMIQEMLETDLLWMRDSAVYVMHALGAPWCLPALERMAKRPNENPELLLKILRAIEHMKVRLEEERTAAADAPSLLVPEPVSSAPSMAMGGLPVESESVGPDSPEATGATGVSPGKEGAARVFPESGGADEAPSGIARDTVELESVSGDSTLKSGLNVLPLTQANPPTRLPARLTRQLSLAETASMAPVVPYRGESSGSTVPSPEELEVAKVQMGSRDQGDRILGLNVLCRSPGLDARERVELAVQDVDEAVRTRAREVLDQMRAAELETQLSIRLGSEVFRLDVAGGTIPDEYQGQLAVIREFSKFMDRGTRIGVTLHERDRHLSLLGRRVLEDFRRDQCKSPALAGECQQIEDEIAAAAEKRQRELLPGEGTEDLAPAGDGDATEKSSAGEAPDLNKAQGASAAFDASDPATRATPRQAGPRVQGPRTKTGRLEIQKPAPVPFLARTGVKLVLPVGLGCFLLVFVGWQVAQKSTEVSGGGSIPRYQPPAEKILKSLSIRDVIEGGSGNPYKGRGVRWTGSVEDRGPAGDLLRVVCDERQFTAEFSRAISQGVQRGDRVTVDGAVQEVLEGEIVLKGIRVITAQKTAWEQTRERIN